MGGGNEPQGRVGKLASNLLTHQFVINYVRRVVKKNEDKDDLLIRRQEGYPALMITERINHKRNMLIKTSKSAVWI